MTPTNTDRRHLQTVKGASSIALLAGLWFFVSPWVYGAQMAANAWNSWIVGAVIVILAAIRVANPVNAAGLSWVNCILGVWAFISPWIYGYTSEHGRFINSLCVGVIVFAVAIWSASSTPHTQHPATPHASS